MTLDLLAPMTLVDYQHFLQNTRAQANTTTNGHLSVLSAGCTWLTKLLYLEVNLVKLVSHEEASSRKGLSNNHFSASAWRVFAEYKAPHLGCNLAIKTIHPYLALC